MALFTSNLTIKTTRDMSDSESFIKLLKPGSKYGLFPGELALYVDDIDGLKLYALNQNNEVVQIQSGVDEFADVVLDNLQQGDVLMYNGSNWRNTQPPVGTIAGNTLSDLGDVDFTALRTGDQLARVDGEWTNLPGFQTYTLDVLSDVSVSFPLDGQTLIWKASTEEWVNDFELYKLNDLVDVDIESTLPLDGDLLLYDGLRNKWVPGAVTTGNTNTLIIDESEPLPPAPITTLGVSEIDPDDVKNTGNFFWASGPDETSTSWGKAVKAGYAQLDDFIDIDLTGIELGDSLQWTFANGEYSFTPQKFVPRGRAITTDGTVSYPWFTLNGYGERGAQYYAVAGCSTGVNGLFPSGTAGVGRYQQAFYMGMYGMSDTEPGIHVSYDKADEGWPNGLLKFPNDLRPDDRNGLYGIQPLLPEKSHDFATQGPKDYFLDEGDEPGYINFGAVISFYTDFPGGTFDIWDIGHVALFVENGEICVRHNGTEYTPLRTGLFLPSNEQQIKQTLHQVYVNIYDGRVRVFYNGNKIDPIPYTYWQYVPLDKDTYVGPRFGGNGFKGYMGDFRWIFPLDTVGELDPVGDNPDAYVWEYGNLPHGLWQSNSMGQYISANDRGTFIVSKGYVEEDYYTTGEFNFLSRFGSGERMVDLADVDTDSFLNAGREGLAAWNPITQQIEFADKDFDVTVRSSLQFANDVSMYTPEGVYMKTGQTFAWDTRTRKFYPTSLVGSFTINEAEDVNITSGLYGGNILSWDSASNKWRPVNAPNQPAIPLDDLTDVNLAYNVPETGYTLIYSEALSEWVAGPAPWSGANEIGELTDVDLSEGVNDEDVLAYDTRTKLWKPSRGPDTKVLNDLGDVDTKSRPPKEGQGLQWQTTAWVPADYAKGGASYLGELFDVKSDHAQPGDGLVWDGTYFRSQPIASGRGDGGDFGSGHVLSGYVVGVYGGGDFDIEAADIPVEQQGLVDGGLFM